MSSPIKLDGEKFILPVYPINRFHSLGQQRGHKGITHSIFMNKERIHPSFFVGPAHELSGYCSYRLVYNNNESILCGVAFSSFSNKTVVNDIALRVGNIGNELPESFEPWFILESTGILLFKCTDSSLLAIPSDVTSSMLVRAD